MSNTQQLAYSIPDFMRLTGLSRQSTYDQINAGRLVSFRVGRRRLISRTAAERWVQTLETETNAPATDLADDGA